MKDSFVIQQDAFQGPLDTLLEMVQKRKLTIHDVSLAQVAEEFITHVKDTVQSRPHSYVAAGMVIAATLVLIKSRSLIPHAKIETEDEEEAHQLAYRLNRLQAFKKAARTVGELWLTTAKPITRSYSFPKKAIVFSADESINAGSLHSAMLHTLSQVEVQKQPKTVKVKATLALNKMMEVMGNMLQKNTVMPLFSFLKNVRNEFGSTENVSAESTRMDIAVGVCAALELVKMNTCAISQNEAGEISIHAV